MVAIERRPFAVSVLVVGASREYAVLRRLLLRRAIVEGGHPKQS